MAKNKKKKNKNKLAKQGSLFKATEQNTVVDSAQEPTAKADLTDKQDMFCLEYTNPYQNGAEAYRKSYCPKEMSNESIHQEVNQLLKNPKVTLRIKHYKAILTEKKVIDATKVLENISEAANLPIYDSQGKVIITAPLLSCRTKANELLGKHLGIIDGDTVKPLTGDFTISWKVADPTEDMGGAK